MHLELFWCTMKQTVKLSESKNRAQRLKQLIVTKLLQHIEIDEISISQIAKLTRISKERVSILLNPSHAVIDLVVLCAVTRVLGLRLRFNGVLI